MSDEVAIKVEHVSKTFKLPHEKVSSVKGALINFARHNKGYETQCVLDDISFEIKKGEFFGIVGRNGSGKSTLLKLLAGIYNPNKGTIQVNGKLTPFIELGVGFNHELTGRENVFLNGALLGFNRKEMGAMYNGIVEFAELERFMDQKLKNYSSGMQVRLAFSIAIRAQSDALVLDEVLAVGDMAFQRKCFDYFLQLKASKQTVILVTHDMNAVRQYCDSAIMLEQGKIVAAGTAEEVAQKYQKLFSEPIVQTQEENDQSNDKPKRWGTGRVRTTATRIDLTNSRLLITTIYKVAQEVVSPIFGFSIYGPNGENIVESNTYQKKIQTKPLRRNQLATIVWEVPNIFSDGRYKVAVAACNASKTEFFDWLNDAAVFTINSGNSTGGIVNPNVAISKYKVEDGK